jgi:hypothetical protein
VATTEELIELIRQGAMFGGGTTLYGNQISPYEAFRLEIEEVIVKDEKLVFLARRSPPPSTRGPRW